MDHLILFFKQVIQLSIIRIQSSHGILLKKQIYALKFREFRETPETPIKN